MLTIANIAINTIMQLISHEVIEPDSTPLYSVIWIHGLGGQGKNFRPMLSQLKLDAPARFIMPNASSMHVTFKNNQYMPSWYNVISINGENRNIDKLAFDNSISSLEDLVANEARIVGYENIVLAGFSQGGAMALHLGLKINPQVAGIIAISTYLPMASELEFILGYHKKMTQICCMHGTKDNIVDITQGRFIYDFLQIYGYSVKWSSYETAHMISNQQIKDIGNWLNKLFSNSCNTI